MTVNSRTFLFIGLIALLIPNAFAHTYLSSVVLNNQALAEGDCMRPHPPTAFDAPISLVSSRDMTCGFLPYSAQPANRKCPIQAGSSIGLQWHHNSASPSDDIVDPSHVGPVIVYLAKSDTGAGNVWFKIYQDGYNPTTKKWATDTLIANRGVVNIKIPSDIAPGNYLLRGEILALHNGYALDGVQPYVGCVELTISGSGSANPAGVAFPGAYVNNDGGLLFDVYKPFSSYPIPGPALYTAGSNSGSGSGSGATQPTIAPRPTTPANTNPTPTSTPTPTYPANPTTPSYPGSNTGSNSGNGITLVLNGGSNRWWLGVSVVGGSKSTVRVEIKDSGSIDWTALSDYSYAYVFDKSKQLTPPISVRVTASDNSQLTFTNIFTTFTPGSFNTGKDYGAGAEPTSRPPTTAPTTRPNPTTTTAPTTPKPTTQPSSSASVTVYPGASEWWFAVTVQGIAADSISKVEVKDSSSGSNYAEMAHNSWGYALPAQGRAFVTPLSVRVTNKSGQIVTASVATISGNSVFRAL